MGTRVASSALTTNPVAVLINKAMIEIPPKFAGKSPVFPGANTALTTWSGAAGLAEDVRRYGQWMRDEAFKRIGHLYPPIEITKAMVKERPDLKQYEGDKLTVIAWLWARTVKSPNPAFSNVEVPLASSFILSSKEGKEAYVQPVVSKSGYSFTGKIVDSSHHAGHRGDDSPIASARLVGHHAGHLDRLPIGLRLDRLRLQLQVVDRLIRE